jgi:hypothetical protein
MQMEASRRKAKQQRIDNFMGELLGFENSF